MASVLYPRRVETDRLVLRAWEPTDQAAVRTVFEDRDVVQSIQPGAEIDPEAVAADYLARRIGGWERDGFGLWAAVERSSAEVIGWTGAWQQDIAIDFPDDVEVGWTLRRPWWGRGLATEGARAAVEAAFAELPVDRLVHLIHPENARSIAVATRLGSTKIGTTRHARVPGLELQVYALERSTVGASPQSRSSR
jgi:RimJ/RimL family protein N-acetyltransferase